MRHASMRVFSRFSAGFSVSLLGVLLSGCGPSFDPPSEMNTLRVLGVQKDKPYAQPGDTVNIKMLWEDASPKELGADGMPRKVTIAWSSPCANPAGDLYYNCFSDPAVFGDPTKITLNSDTTSFTVPDDLILPRPAPNAPYGVEYIFFAACAGTLSFTPPSAANAASDNSTGSIPIACLDPTTNAPLGSDDFVAGYTSIYAFKGFSNKNPIITGFSFNGVALPDADVCLSSGDSMTPPASDACLPIAEAQPPDPAKINCSDPGETRCVPTCADDGDSKCPAYAVKPTMTQADNQEQDSVSAQLLGRDVTEEMWIDYYADGGGFKSSVRLLNDATSGWNDDFGTDFYAPKAAKVSRIWALAHDNRGGAAWAGISVKTQ